MSATFITINGNLTSNPQLRRTQAGVSVTDFRVASNERRRDSSGNWVDGPTTYYKVTCWREFAERVARCLHSGDAVVVYGKFLGRSWTNDDGSYTCFDIDGYNIGPDLKFVEAVAERKSRVSAEVPPAAESSFGAPASSEDPWATEVSPSASEPAA